MAHTVGALGGWPVLPWLWGLVWLSACLLLSMPLTSFCFCCGAQCVDLLMLRAAWEEGSYVNVCIFVVVVLAAIAALILNCFIDALPTLESFLED